MRGPRCGCPPQRRPSLRGAEMRFCHRSDDFSHRARTVSGSATKAVEKSNILVDARAYPRTRARSRGLTRESQRTHARSERTRHSLVDSRAYPLTRAQSRGPRASLIDAATSLADSAASLANSRAYALGLGRSRDSTGVCVRTRVIRWTRARVSWTHARVSQTHARYPLDYVRESRGTQARI